MALIQDINMWHNMKQEILIWDTTCNIMSHTVKLIWDIIIIIIIKSFI